MTAAVPARLLRPRAGDGARPAAWHGADRRRGAASRPGSCGHCCRQARASGSDSAEDNRELCVVAHHLEQLTSLEALTDGSVLTESTRL
ncbi:MAG: hypothetical protein R3C24_17200 [Cyanobacteriota/Melainabacteria group bacterium]